MTRIIHAHYDGKHIIPDEPLDWPVGGAMEIVVRPASSAQPSPDSLSDQEWWAAFERLSGSVKGVTLTGSMSRSDNFYDEREPE